MTESYVQCVRWKIKLPLLLLHRITVFQEIPLVSRPCFQVSKIALERLIVRETSLVTGKMGTSQSTLILARIC